MIAAPSNVSGYRPGRHSRPSSPAPGSPPAGEAGGEKPRTIVKLAENWAELSAAFHTLYEAYRRAGLAAQNSTKLRATRHHLLPTTEVIIVVREQVVAATLTLVMDGEFGLPLEELYPAEVAQRRAMHGRIAEASCLAERLPSPGAFSRDVMDAMRLMLQCAIRRGAKELLIAVHPHHTAFYRRLGFTRIGEQRQYRSVCENPAVAMALNCDVDHIRENCRHTFRLFLREQFPDEAFQRQPISQEANVEMQKLVWHFDRLLKSPDLPDRRTFPSLREYAGAGHAPG